MNKKKYEKPTMKVYELQSRTQILCASSDPLGVPYWDGEGE